MEHSQRARSIGKGLRIALAGVLAIFLLIAAPGMIRPRNSGDLLCRQLPVGAIHQRAQLAASMNRVCPRRSRNLPFPLLRVRNHRQAGICVP